MQEQCQRLAEPSDEEDTTGRIKRSGSGGGDDTSMSRLQYIPHREEPGVNEHEDALPRAELHAIKTDLCRLFRSYQTSRDSSTAQAIQEMQDFVAGMEDIEALALTIQFIAERMLPDSLIPMEQRVYPEPGSPEPVPPYWVGYLHLGVLQVEVGNKEGLAGTMGNLRLVSETSLDTMVEAFEIKYGKWLRDAVFCFLRVAGAAPIPAQVLRARTSTMSTRRREAIERWLNDTE